MNIRDTYRYYLLEKKRLKIQREVKLPLFGNAAKVGILWHFNDEEAFIYLSEFLNQKKMVSGSLCYKDSSKKDLANSFGKKEVNFFGFPKSGSADFFMETDYDLLMNISVTVCFPLDVVTALTKAQFKIGWALGPVNYFDMNIDVGKNKNALYLVKQQIHYLEQFSKTKQG